MKKVNLSKFVKLSWALLVVVGLAFVTTSCKDDKDDPEPEVIVLDGVYIRSGLTASADFDLKAKLKATRNEVNQEERAQLMEIYIAVKGGEPGFNIVSVAGNFQTTFGPGADFAVVPEAERNIDEPEVDFWRGSYAEGTTVFKVPTDGLYHVVIDTEIKKIVIAPVVWGIIGGATPGGWDSSTELTPSAFDLKTITFEATDMTLTRDNYKFRYSNGWKIILDPDFDLGGGLKGINVNTNFGGAPTALIPGGPDISNSVRGKYTVTMVWTLGANYAATLTKTDDLDMTDYTNTQLGLVGDGLMVNGEQHNWDETIMLSTPTVENQTTYTWTYNNVGVTTAGSFKIREGQDWSGKGIGFNDVTMAGVSANEFETNTDGNFVPLEDGTYDMVLKIDAVTEIYTLTVNPIAAPAELYMLGNGCDAGWDYENPMPMDGTGGLYTITAELKGAGTGVKFITTPGQDTPQYGTNAAGTSTEGTLFYRGSIGQKEPKPIPAPETIGNYIITVNTSALTYTIAPAR